MRKLCCYNINLQELKGILEPEMGVDHEHLLVRFTLNRKCQEGV